MKKVVIYTRLSSKTGLDHDGQREEILARLGGEYEIIGEYRDVASGTQEIQERPGLKAMLDAVAKGRSKHCYAATLPGSPGVSHQRSLGRFKKPGCRS